MRRIGRGGGGASAPAHVPLVPQAVDPEWLDNQVTTEQMRQHMRGQALTAASGFVPIVYTVWTLRAGVPMSSLLIWAGILAIIDVLAVAHASRYLRRGPGRWHRDTWRRRQIALQGLAGFAWGGVGVWIDVGLHESGSIMAILVTVMCLGVIGLVHYHVAVITYTASVWIIPLVVSLAMGQGFGTHVALSLIVLVLSLNFYLWEFTAQFISGLRSRFSADALSQALLEIATRDELTGLFNRREGMRRLADLDDAARTGPAGTRYSLVMLDIDSFKQINDTYGHPVGDEVLREVSRRLTSNINDGGVVARVGGEEFMVLLPGITGSDAATTEQDAHLAAERVRRELDEHPVDTEVGPLKVTASLGVASSAGTISSAEVITRADRALYAAKAAGRNQTRSYSHPGSPLEVNAASRCSE